MNLAEHFLKHGKELKGLTAFLAAGGVVYLVPVANPDGFDAEARFNAASEIVRQNNLLTQRLDHVSPDDLGNLNRDFAILPRDERRFTNPESARLASYIDNDLRNGLRLVFSSTAMSEFAATDGPYVSRRWRIAGGPGDDLTAFRWLAANCRVRRIRFSTCS